MQGVQKAYAMYVPNMLTRAIDDSLWHGISSACMVGICVMYTLYAILSQTLCKHQPAAVFCACFKYSSPHGVLGDGTACTQRIHSVAGNFTARILAICNFLGCCKDATLVWQGFKESEESQSLNWTKTNILCHLAFLKWLRKWFLWYS